MESPEIISWEIPGSDGQPIYGNEHWPDEVPLGLFFCCHGFKGYKDYGFLPLLCDAVSRAGLVAFRFNFSHSGMTHRTETFERPENFEHDTWSKQITDLAAVISEHGSGHQGARFSNAQEWAGNYSDLPCILFGHSRGGVTSLLSAAWGQDSGFYERYWDLNELRSLTALITAAAPDYACNLDDLAKDQLRAEGRLLSPSGRTGQDLYVGRDWLDEIERDPELYDPVLAAAHVKCPTLIIHGSGDTTVPVECAHNLHHAATPNSRLAIIEGASHTFDCPNPLPIDTPWEEVPAATRELIDLTVDFAVEQCEKARSV